MWNKRMKRFIALGMASLMMFSVAACGGKDDSKAEKGEETKTEETAKVEDDANRPEGVTAEDWAKMKEEPVFGKEINYLYNGGACVSAIYMAQVLGYYEEYGINASYLQGGSVVDTVGTGQCMWGTDHIATMLVPVVNGVDMTFVCGSHIGCKSIFVPVDSDIKTVEDLKGKKVAIHDGVGQSDNNICYRLIDEYGVDPTKDVQFVNIEDSAATVEALKNGEVDASIFSDYFVLAKFRQDFRMICSITYSEEFKDDPCCVTAMSNNFIKENPVHAKYVVKAIKRAGEYNRLNSEDAIQTMFDTDKMTGEFQDQLDCWDPLYFGLSDAFTEASLRDVAEDYLRLGIITKKDMSVDEVLEKAWTVLCPDEEIEDYTVGDPVDKGASVPVKQKENPSIPTDFGNPAN